MQSRIDIPNLKPCHGKRFVFLHQNYRIITYRSEIKKEDSDKYSMYFHYTEIYSDFTTEGWEQAFMQNISRMSFNHLDQ